MNAKIVVFFSLIYKRINRKILLGMVDSENFEFCFWTGRLHLLHVYNPILQGRLSLKHNSDPLNDYFWYRFIKLSFFISWWTTQCILLSQNIFFSPPPHSVHSQNLIKYLKNAPIYNRIYVTLTGILKRKNEKKKKKKNNNIRNVYRDRDEGKIKLAKK